MQKTRKSEETRLDRTDVIFPVHALQGKEVDKHSDQNRRKTNSNGPTVCFVNPLFVIMRSVVPYPTPFLSFMSPDLALDDLFIFVVIPPHSHSFGYHHL